MSLSVSQTLPLYPQRYLPPCGSVCLLWPLCQSWALPPELCRRLSLQPRVGEGTLRRCGAPPLAPLRHARCLRVHVLMHPPSSVLLLARRPPPLPALPAAVAAALLLDLRRQLLFTR